MPSGVYVPARWNDLAVDVSVGSPAQGAVSYFGGTHWNALAPGTSGQVLTSGGPAANPAWATPTPGVTTLDGLSDVNLPVASQGDLLYRNASEWVRLQAGTSGQVLQTLGGAADPAWTDSSTLTPSSGAVILAPATSARNVIQPTGDFKSLVLKSNAAQTVSLFETQNSDGTIGIIFGNNAQAAFGSASLSSNAWFQTNHSFTDLSGTFFGFRGLSSADPTADTSGIFNGSQFQVSTSTAFNLTNQVIAGAFSCNHSGSGTLANGFGANITVNKNSTGPITNAHAGNFRLTNINATGAIATGNTIRCQSPGLTGGITACRGINVQNMGGAGVTTSHGILIDNQTGATTSHALFCAGGRSTFQAGAAAIIPVVVQGAASQTANLQEWQDSSSVSLASISAGGAVVTSPVATSTFATVANFQGGGNADNAGAVVEFGPAAVNFGGKIVGGRWASSDRGMRITAVSSVSGENVEIRMNAESSGLSFWTAGNERMTFSASATLATALAWTNTSPGNAAIPLSIKGASAQMADLVQFQNNASRRLVAISNIGDLIFYRDSSTPAERQAFDMTTTFATATDASRKARTVFNIWDTAVREAFRIEASGTAPMIGFLGATAVVRQTATAAATDLPTVITLANSLRTALNNLGLTA